MNEPRPPSQHGTFFAPVGRATPVEVSEQASLCMDDPLIHALLEAVDSYAVVLNAQRQVLAANPALLEALSVPFSDSCQGMRLGEAFDCIRVEEGPDGCGSSKACRRCGALLAVLASQARGETSTGECLISMKRGGRWEAREFAVRSLPLTVVGHQLTLLTLQDIGARKRRETLERIFIHDLSNSLQGLQGWAELLQAAGTDAQVVAGRILEMADHLTAEVESQRRLLLAESGELVADNRRIAPDHILDELETSLGTEVMARMNRLRHPAGAGAVHTDAAILCRVIGNMVVNAVEALPMGGQAQIWHERRGDHVVFVVQNPGCMPPEVAERVFQRSFSTKATRGRGLGTYGMKLLGETILGGRVGFTTDWTDGTRFFIELPAAD